MKYCFIKGELITNNELQWFAVTEAKGDIVCFLVIKFSLSFEIIWVDHLVAGLNQ